MMVKADNLELVRYMGTEVHYMRVGSTELG